MHTHRFNAPHNDHSQYCIITGLNAISSIKVIFHEVFNGFHSVKCFFQNFTELFLEIIILESIIRFFWILHLKITVDPLDFIYQKPIESQILPNNFIIIPTRIPNCCINITLLRNFTNRILPAHNT